VNRLEQKVTDSTQISVPLFLHRLASAFCRDFDCFEKLLAVRVFTGFDGLFDGLPLDALGVYLPSKLQADNFLLYFRIYGTFI
jgi:hypothetical protein